MPVIIGLIFLFAVLIPEVARAQGAPSVTPPPAVEPSAGAAPREDPSGARHGASENNGTGELERRAAELEARVRKLETEGARNAAEAEEPPLAGYSEKNFFLRDRNDDFVLIPKGRVNVDYYHFLNRGDLPRGATDNGPTDTRPRDVLFVRRARVGLAGTVAKIVDFRVEGDFASLPTPPGQYATLADASIVVNATPYLKLEVGQFYAPFTLENPTSENYVDFLEKSAAVRFAVPTSREGGAMLFGELPNKALRYWLGAFDGEGQNVKNLDDNPAVIGRAIVSPLAFVPQHEKWVENLWIGGSLWAQRNTNVGAAGTPSLTGASQGDLSSFSTQGGWSIFNSSYSNGVDATGAAVRSHLAANGSVAKYAIELNVPIGTRFGLRGELIHESMGLQQYDDVNVSGNPTRTVGRRGKLTGTSGYAEVYVWLGHALNVDVPGLYQVPHWRGYQPGPDPAWAVMLAAKYEHVGFDIDGLPRRTSATGSATADAANGHYALDVLELGGSLWYTRHSRFMLNYVLNAIGGGDAASSALKKNLFYDTAEHELLFRWAVSL